MQPRRVSTPSPRLASSPPLASLQEGEGTRAESPAQSLWTAPSPTQTLGHSSPELPPLPSLPTLGGVPKTPSTAAKHQHTDSTYYTASWGSPYDRPPPNPHRQAGGRRHSSIIGSDDIEEGSPKFGLDHLLPARFEEDGSANVHFGLDHLLPSRFEEDGSANVHFGLEHLVPSRLPPNIASTPTRPSSFRANTAPDRTPRPSIVATSPIASFGQASSATEDWVRQFVTRQWDGDKDTVWGDESTGSESGAQPRVKSSRSAEKPSQGSSAAKGHRSRKDNLTLKQEDFWVHFQKGQERQLTKMFRSRFADPVPAASNPEPTAEQPPSPTSFDKPLPPPPSVIDTISPVPPGVATPDMLEDRRTESPKSPIVRQRKKVVWKNKACWINLPSDHTRGVPGGPPRPLSEREVHARLAQFERASYDTRGFDHWGGREPTFFDTERSAQGRPVYPTPEDHIYYKSNGPMRVKFPNMEDWKEYVNFLTEQKLRALGVSLGDEPAESPVTMSRQASSQYPALPFSPPPPTSSAGSQRMARPGSIVSNGFPHGPSPGHMSRGSVASPLSSFGNPRPGMHMHRHSTFTSPSSFSQQQPTTPGLPAWSPQQHFNQNVMRGGSPALPHLSNSRPELLDAIMSPSSPFGYKPTQQLPFPPQRDDVLAHLQQQQQLQAQLLQQQQQQQQQQKQQQQAAQLQSTRPSSTLEEVPEVESEDEAPAVKEPGTPVRDRPEIVVPTPRGHRHNISQNLEREIRDAEYHLEEAIDRQLGDDGDFGADSKFDSKKPVNNLRAQPPTDQNPWQQSKPSNTVLHQPQPHSRGHSLTQKQNDDATSYDDSNPAKVLDDLDDEANTNPSEVETNPSVEGQDKDSTFDRSRTHSHTASQVSDNRSVPMHSRHVSKASLSKLNVGAKEFVFNPGASFTPTTFTFGAAASKPPPVSISKPNSKPSTRGPSIDGSSLNVAAPSFQPSAPKPAAVVPSSNFSFLSTFKAATFKPDAPVFQPGAFSAPLPKADAALGANAPERSRIFSPITLSNNDIVKPAKRSKAVPIVRPDGPDEVQIVLDGHEDSKEDSDGRITQSDDRHKRARHVGDDGDQVPQFATPSPLSEMKNTQTGVRDTPRDSSVPPAGKENLAPESTVAVETKADSESVKPVVPTHADLPANDDDDVMQQEDQPSMISQPESVGPVASEPISAADHESFSSDGTALQTEPKKHVSKGSLSATAKPFEYKPRGEHGFDFGIHVTQPSREVAKEPEKTRASPARQLSRSPATTFRPSDDGSWKTALEGRKNMPYPDSDEVDYDSFVQPSFNEIDAVMKHLNEEGSDFGIERDIGSWDVSSPPRNLIDVGHTVLHPTQPFRSDAPSPSPRRSAFGNASSRDAESTPITQDPFDDERAGLAYESPVHRLNVAEDVAVSDWDDMISSQEDDKIQARSAFFDQHVDGIIGGVLESRLGPLEENMRIIQQSINMIAEQRRHGRLPRGSLSGTGLDSDADDEDESEAEARFRNRSPRKDRKLEKIRNIVVEAISAQQQREAPVQQLADLTAIQQALADLKATSSQPQSINLDAIQEALADVKASVAQPAPASLQLEDVKGLLEDTLAQQKTESAQQLQHLSTIEDASAKIVQLEQLLKDSAEKALQPEDIKSMLDDAITRQSSALAQQHQQSAIQEGFALAETTTRIAGLERILQESGARMVKSEDIKEAIEDALERQNMAMVQSKESSALEQNNARFADLEQALKDATERADEEGELRAKAERREAETDRLLKLTEEELALLKVSNSDEEHKVGKLCEETQDAREKLAVTQKAQEELQSNLSNLTAENEALQATLVEYRVSSAQWRDDLRGANENKEASQKEIMALKSQIDEAMRIRDVMRGKIDRLQQDMVTAAGTIAGEKATWQKKDEEHRIRYEVLSARAEAEARTRERLERELERLEGQEREGMRLKVMLEQVQSNNVQLEETVNQLRTESIEAQKKAGRYEREFHEAREAGRIEVHRTRVLMEADIEAANNQVNIIRAGLESEISRVRTELENVKMDADTAKARHELLLESEADAKRDAVNSAKEVRAVALQEQQLKFERRLEDLKQQHSREIQNALEDKQRAETHLKERLSFADEKMEHLHDKIALLEEKVEVAKSAAKAAAKAAQGKKSFISSFSGIPDKVSPQALRESIVVLQEQLQQRESKIEGLEHQLSELDTEAPAKLKERDTEIAWLRELLGVRIDDLSELVNALSQPAFDREAVRDAAIRIRTNLQMEQQEKERLIAGPQSFPTLSTLSNFASPKAVQLAAAIGSWRKGRDTSSSNLTQSSANTSRTQTPSRTRPVPAAQGFLSGLMTPPTSNLRRTPEPQAQAGAQNMSGLNSRYRSADMTNFSTRRQEKQPILMPPSTPPLLRKASYDQDAEDGDFSTNGFYDDEGSTIDGNPGERAQAFEPFGPSMHG